MENELEWLEQDVKDTKIEFQKARIIYHKAKEARNLARLEYNLARLEYNMAKEKRRAYFEKKHNLRLEQKLSALGIVKIPLGPGRAHYEFVGVDVGKKGKEDLH